MNTIEDAIQDIKDDLVDLKNKYADPSKIEERDKFNASIEKLKEVFAKAHPKA